MVGHATHVDGQTLPTRRRSIASRAASWAQMPPTRPPTATLQVSSPSPLRMRSASASGSRDKALRLHKAREPGRVRLNVLHCVFTEADVVEPVDTQDLKS